MGQEDILVGDIRNRDRAAVNIESRSNRQETALMTVDGSQHQEGALIHLRTETANP